MTFTVIDIETAPQTVALRAPYPHDERPCPSNYKDPEKIAAWYIRDEAEWRANRAKECALSPRLGRVVAVGVYHGTGSVQVELTEENECVLIERALTEIGTALQGNMLVTFNGLTFDLPFLHVRAAINGQRIAYDPGRVLRRYAQFPHADIRAILTNWDQRTTGTLHEWCAAFSIPVHDETTGADIGAMVDAGDVEGIRAHCASDLGLTHQLAHKLRAAGMI